jgi:hypothetical protein
MTQIMLPLSPKVEWLCVWCGHLSPELDERCQKCGRKDE